MLHKGKSWFSETGVWKAGWTEEISNESSGCTPDHPRSREKSSNGWIFISNQIQSRNGITFWKYSEGFCFSTRHRIDGHELRFCLSAVTFLSSPCSNPADTPHGAENVSFCNSPFLGSHRVLTGENSWKHGTSGWICVGENKGSVSVWRGGRRRRLRYVFSKLIEGLWSNLNSEWFHEKWKPLPAVFPYCSTEK